jgi:hypothetical protein
MGEEVVEQKEVAEGSAVVEVEVAVEEKEEEANKLQQHQLPILQEMALKEYHLPSFKGTPRCSTHSNKSGSCIGLPMLTTMT